MVFYLTFGVSSYQLDERTRGFSYLGEEVLDMRMDRTKDLDAKYILNYYTEENIAKILYEYGEEKFAKNIAKNICIERNKKEITTTKELVEIIDKSIPMREKQNGHPAKKTFQAIRIETNNELEPLCHTVKESIKLLNNTGRLCIITFHSLEDRIVKNAYIDMQGKCTCPSGFPQCVCGYQSYGRMITKKPIIATMEEQQQNSRSKSAKLRIFERII